MKKTRWIAVAGVTLGTVASGQSADPPLYTQDVVGALVSVFSCSMVGGPRGRGPALPTPDDVTFDTTVRVTSLTWWGSAIVCGSPFTVSRFDGVTKIIVEFYANGTDASGFDAPTGTPQTYEFFPGFSIEELPPAGLTEGNAGFENRVFFSTPVEIPAFEKTWVSIVAVTTENYAWATQGTGTDSPDFGTDGVKSKARNIGAGWVAIDAVFGGQAFSLEGFEVVSDPVSALASLVETVQILNLRQGIDNSLDAKLDAAINALMDQMIQNDVAAIGALEAFISATQAQSGHLIPTLDADNLIEQAEQIILLISSP